MVLTMTITPKLNAEFLVMIEEIDEFGQDLTEWEVRFIADLIDRYVTAFSSGQAKQIERIHEERVP